MNLNGLLAPRYRLVLTSIKNFQNNWIVMETKLKRAFADTLKKYRKKKNLSQEELAFAAGLTRAHISDLEAGEIDPGFYTVFKLSKALKINNFDAFDHNL